VNAIDKVLDHLDEYTTELASLMTERFEVLTCA